MTIAHAESYLARLREESPSASPIMRPTSKLRAKRQWPNALRYAKGEAIEARFWMMQTDSWDEDFARFRRMVRVYDESIRLRAIAEGRKP